MSHTTHSCIFAGKIFHLILTQNIMKIKKKRDCIFLGRENVQNGKTKDGRERI